MDQETAARFERIEINLEKLTAEHAAFAAMVRGAFTLQQEQIADLVKLSAKHEAEFADIRRQMLAYLTSGPPQ